MTDSAILITVQNGTVDFCSTGDLQTVVVDFDSFDPDKTFPDDIDILLKKVLELPPGIPWKGGIISRLNEVKRACKNSLWTTPTGGDT